ncbi:flagellar hook-associated protein FlgK [Paracoccus sp. (in: a-proteobacteria)]|uniref:flagellar hook-associated protein FlgK n=1 Tax=Paracoccus sp. TaxID=267 RepID=UPI0026E09833|nr:flagellar hook-associated protein FlgK [Paracoccus sp. (in: a-proteobacteria)]MDO5369823.1 flagellar hook-associated protein FlgK [Paracoccus sp. (in: a-proteobacteria)]
MSLSNALTNAVSGLVAASRGTEVVASNLANAATPGYARRELQMAARPLVSGGGGVHVDGAVRMVQGSVLAQARLAGAETARAETLAEFHKSVSDAIGVPGEAGSLTTLLSQLDGALVAAAARPESEAGLSQAVSAARDLARACNTLGAHVQDARSAADRAIGADVQALNSGLKRVAELNRQITVQMTGGKDANALQDERQRTIDGLSQIVPLKELPREGGRVALFTAEGGVLLDGFAPASLEFTAVGLVTADMSAGSSALGLLRLKGEPVPTGQMGRFAGGRLAANFQIRDLDGPLAQARLDAAAADLHDRFAGAASGPTPWATAPGLFIDASPAAPGLAQRIAVNAAVDPAAGGAVWRLRDGMAAAPGPVGNGDLLMRMQEALDGPRAVPGLGAVPRSAAGHAAELTSLAASGRLSAERDVTTAMAQSSAYDTMLRQDGVDSDREMETLLALERAYASNAKVLQAVDDMIQTILRLT